jgi:site-specific DNA-methyltransferase (adenine-specific)
MRDFRILLGDCRDRLKELPDNSIDSIVTDPPYELGFMGKSWDASGVAYDVTVWQECLRVLKPGGHLLSFGGSRTYHRMACAIEDAGFQIRDQIMWVYGSGFPKSLNIGKALDRVAGAEREVIGTIRNNQPGGTSAFAEGGVGSYQRGDTTERDIVGGPVTPEAEVWNGWGTALKPAHEPIVLARKPLDGTVANNVLKHGVGGLNIDGCRVGDEVLPEQTAGQAQIGTFERTNMVTPERTGRFPANFIHDGSDEVLELFPDSKGGAFPKKSNIPTGRHYEGGWGAVDNGVRTEMGEGSAARFFYCAKASKKDRNEGLDGFEEKQTLGGGGLTAEIKEDGSYETASAGGKFGSVKAKQTNHHPTVKPTDLMRYLCKLVTPPNGTVLDPFTGSGSTGKAAVLEGFNFIGVEQSEEYIAIAEARIKSVYDSRA